MKRFSNLFAMSLIFIFIFSILAVSEEPPKQEKNKLSEEELWNIYYDLIAKIKPYEIPFDRAEHEKLVKPSMKIYEGDGVEAWSDHYAYIGNEKKLTVSIDIMSGEIISLYVTSVRKKVDESLEENKSEKLKFTEQKAIHYAKYYLILNTRIALQNYETVVSNRDGYWSVYFWRTLGSYRFYKDNIAVHFSEKYGLISYHNWLFSEECDTKAKISKKEAIELGKKNLESIMNSWYKTKSIKTKLEDATLMIINPFLLENDLCNKRHSLDEMRQTRLAWKVLYFEDPFFMGCYAISIYIDAITGKQMFWYQVAP
jgi:hypothetical protein